MSILRTPFSILICVIAYAAEVYASSKFLFIPTMHNAHEYSQALEWQRELEALMGAIPIVTIILLVAIWWEPLKHYFSMKGDE